jgi:conjugal transfer pilus assembly protein TraV
MHRFVALTFVLLTILLSGCATPKYACGVPDGIGCKPLSEVHRMAQNGSLKSQAVPDNRDTSEQDQDEEDFNNTEGEQTPSLPSRRSVGLATVTPGTPLFIPPRTMRVWVAPWPDEDGTLHDETYLYLRLDNGHWVMEKP